MPDVTVPWHVYMGVFNRLIRPCDLSHSFNSASSRGRATAPRSDTRLSREALHA
jgi:hypothetical protein